MDFSNKAKEFFIMKAFAEYWKSDNEALTDWLESEFSLTEDEINQIAEFAETRLLMSADNKNYWVCDFIESETS
jgi:hypothetical protein